MTTKLRCSSMDKLFACPPSVMGHPGMVPISIMSGDAARAGQIVHGLLADYIQTGTYNVAEACGREGVIDDSGVENISQLVDYGIRCWQEMEQYFTDARVECHVESEVLSSPIGDVQLDGTTDVLSPIGVSNGVFLDWKTGWIDKGHSNQGYAYAKCMWDLLGQPEQCVITGVFAYLRHRYYRVVKYRPSDIKDWTNDLTRNVLARAEKAEFSPGEQCNYCDYYSTCKARSRVTEGLIDTLMLGQTHSSNDEYQRWLEGVQHSIAHMTEATEQEAGEAVSTLYERTRMLDRMVGDLKAMLRDAAEKHGPLPMGGDMELAIEEQERRTLDSVPALRVMRRHMSDTQIAEAARFSLSKALDIYAKQVHTQERSAAKAELAEALEKGGAVQRSVVRKLTARHKAPIESVERAKAKEDTQETTDARLPNEHQHGG